MNNQPISTTLFIDDQFTPCDRSLYVSTEFKEQILINEIKWKRASELVSNPEFAIDDVNNTSFIELTDKNYRDYFSVTDLNQGIVGNCWFISSLSSILKNYEIFKNVVNFENTFNSPNYTGKFKFRFWRFGKWIDIIIDDYLPVDNNNQLIFARNTKHCNEFWCPLIEKAYAKLYGSYEKLNGGNSIDAMIDMSGGIEEYYNLKKIRLNKIINMGQFNITKNTFWEILLQLNKVNFALTCNIDKQLNASDIMQNGLIRCHSYAITNIIQYSTKNVTYKLIKLYNPWGNEVEWNGKWSDKSYIWELVDNSLKNMLNMKSEFDGEFVMSYEDWLLNFDNCQICNLNINKNDLYLYKKITWQCQIIYGKWTSQTCGGCGNDDISKFWNNPQYTFIVNDGWVIIGLMQNKCPYEYIQYRLYKVKNVDVFNKKIFQVKQITQNDLEKINTIDNYFYSYEAYINKREITYRFYLKSGAYVIVPSCYSEGIEQDFMIRICSEKSNMNSIISNGYIVEYKNNDNKIVENNFNNNYLDTINKLKLINPDITMRNIKNIQKIIRKKSNQINMISKKLSI